jgi:3-oxoacyl-[acyl-carrier protein] reductase
MSLSTRYTTAPGWRRVAAQNLSEILITITKYTCPRRFSDAGRQEINTMAERLLEGKVALVTGAGRGLGRGFAEHLAALGCRVGVHGMRENGPAEYGEGTTLTQTALDIAAAYNTRTCRLLGDLTNAADVQRVVAETCSELGPIDILVHNAGGDIAAAGGKPNPNDCVHIKLEDVRAVLDRNLLSTILVCQETAKIMMPRKTGRILTLSSISAFRGIPSSSIYATAKAGVVEYTRCLAEQLRSFNINVNTLAPGDTRTGRFLGTRKVEDSRLATDGTLDRIGLVDEVTRVVEFFAGPLGAFVTGQVLRVDGGSQIWPA